MPRKKTKATMDPCKNCGGMGFTLLGWWRKVVVPCQECRNTAEKRETLLLQQLDRLTKLATSAEGKIIDLNQRVEELKSNQSTLKLRVVQDAMSKAQEVVDRVYGLISAHEKQIKPLADFAKELERSWTDNERLDFSRRWYEDNILNTSSKNNGDGK